LQPLTTASLWAPQFITRQQPFVVDFIVPIAVSRESQDRSFADMVRGAKADLQIAGSFSLTQLAPVQREQVFAEVR